MSGTDILISPQKINLTLRANDPVSLEMEYLDPGNKPLDLYYLMDLSFTMKDYKVATFSHSSPVPLLFPTVRKTGCQNVLFEAV